MLFVKKKIPSCRLACVWLWCEMLSPFSCTHSVLPSRAKLVSFFAEFFESYLFLITKSKSRPCSPVTYSCPYVCSCYSKKTDVSKKKHIKCKLHMFLIYWLLQSVCFSCHFFIVHRYFGVHTNAVLHIDRFNIQLHVKNYSYKKV